MWVFGYGSLMFKADYEDIVERAVGYVPGWRRTWNQGSTDHRGTEAFPGRVVTVERGGAEDRCWGVAYRLDRGGDDAGTLAALEVREKQYDLRLELPVHVVAPGPDGKVGGRAPTGEVIHALAYVGSPDRARNANYAGPPASVAAAADQILRAEGPSGPNTEYLFKIADFMRSIGIECPETFALEAAVRSRLLQRNE